MLQKLNLIRLAVIIFTLGFLIACDMSEPEYFSVEPMPVMNIEKLKKVLPLPAGIITVRKKAWTAILSPPKYLRVIMEKYASRLRVHLFMKKK